MSKNVEIFVGGDFCPIGRVGLYNDQNSIHKLYGGILNEMSTADLRILNLEAPLTTSLNKISKSGPNIKADPSMIKLLTFANVNLVTLSNNHIMDYGIEGLQSTIATCHENNISTIGAGVTEDTMNEIFYFTKNGIKISILNISENEFNKINNVGANTVNFIDNYKQIKEAKSNSDKLVLIYHGGREHYQLPTPDLRERFRFYAELGADVIVSHHPHCYSGYERYNNALIFYSIGNFLFDYKKKYQKGEWTKGFAIKLSIGDGVEFTVLPFFQGREKNPCIELMAGEDKVTFFNNFNKLSDIIIDDDKFYKTWENYIKSQEKTYWTLLRTPNKYLRFLQTKGLFPFFKPSKEFQNVLLNINRCEAHHEILKNVLSKNNSK